MERSLAVVAPEAQPPKDGNPVAEEVDASQSAVIPQNQLTPPPDKNTPGNPETEQAASDNPISGGSLSLDEQIYLAMLADGLL